MDHIGRGVGVGTCMDHIGRGVGGGYMYGPHW